MKNVTKHIRVGIVGAGTIATTAHLPVLQAMPDVEIAWITDVDERAAAEVARNCAAPLASLSDGIEGLPPCDIALLAIPLGARGGYFEHFARCGAAVLAEKPLAVDACQHAAVTARFASWQLSVGYQRRYYASTTLVRSLIQSGVLGALKQIRVSEGGRVLRTGGTGGYQDSPTSEGGGVARSLGCHSLDLAFWVTQASGFDVVERDVVWDDETDRRAHAKIVLQGVGGVPGRDCSLDWTVSWLDGQLNTYQFDFELAVIRCSVAPAGHVQLFAAGLLLSTLHAPAGHGAVTSAQAFYLEWRDALTSLITKAETMLSAASSWNTAAVLDEVLRTDRS